ncbi:MAG: 3-hydroxybutyryl-CoA dehydrogenase [Ignavibacteria bacterium]
METMITTIGVIGAGTMGSGIAEVAAAARFNVLVHDVAEEALSAGMARIKQSLNRAVEKDRLTAVAATEIYAHLQPAPRLDALRDADVVIEAALERLDVKRELFRTLDALVKREAILTSNTSSLSITAIAAATTRQPQVAGLHFFNPPTVMRLVEVVRGKQTSDETIASCLDLVKRFGKTPVVCGDTPGFIVNRVARPFYGEALRLLGEGIASVETIDRIVKQVGGFKMGPFELMDLIGIDVNYAVTQSVYEQFFYEPRFRPHPIQRLMVEAGTLGRKTKKGFYTYES